jgi:Rieske Fe-S protein
MDDDNVYVVTGDSGMGMTHGTIAGMVLTDLVQGRENAWAALYDPARKPHGVVQYLKENLDVVRKELGDRFERGDVASRDEIVGGRGAIVRDGVHLVACWRDENGALHERSATCPHLGCVVAWNDVEKTWDCPCHGSRFSCRGKVINGPANRDLAPAPGR